ncbi:hypothetical protein AAIH46_11095 [Rhizobium sp. 0TCS1.26]|uniref:hypothetical protein n=1 Tax=Rhizobium sp. 0TCS1.26 TaxID=3142623 RepID=UPI003D2E2A21
MKTGRPATRGLSVGRGRGNAIAAVLLLSAAVFGAALPHVLPLDLSRHYLAEARLAPASQAADDTDRADLVKAAEEGLRSPALLDAVARQVGFVDAAGRTVEDPTAMGLLSEIMSRQDLSDAASETTERQRLSGVLSVAERENGQLAVVARGDNALAASEIANAAARLLSQGINDQQLLGEPDAVARARGNLEKIQSDIDALAVAPADLQRLQEVRDEQAALAAETERLQAAQADAATRVEILSHLTLDDVLSKPLPAELQASGLETLRRKHVEARLLIDQLSAELGPRHPRLIAATAAESEAKQSIARAMKQMTGGLKQEEAALQAQVQETNARKASLAAAPVSDAAARKLALETSLETARKAYLDAVRDAEANPSSAVEKIRFLSAASPAAATASGLPAWLYSLAGAVAGLCLVGAALPGRRIEEPEADLTAEDAPEVLAIPQIAPPMELQIEEPVVDLLALAGLSEHSPRSRIEIAQPQVNSLPAMPSFDDYYREERLSAEMSALPERQAVRTSEAAEGSLEQLLLSNLQPQVTDRPLPQLLAAIMAGQTEQVVSRPTAAPASPEREIAQLRQGIARLRQQVANAVPVPEQEHQPVERRYAGRR